MKTTPWQRWIALAQLVAFTTTMTLEGRAYASHFGGPPSAAGSAGAPAGKILESFHSDLSTGRAVFGIPLAVPPGRRGIQPGLSFTYSSSARNGPLGVGWNLELGSIERSTRLGLPKFDSSDTFVLKFGGVTAELAQITPGEYRLKDEQLFAKILFTTSSWTLTAKDGSVATFGSTSDSQQVVSQGTFGWFLKEVKDIHGNLLTITYTISNRQVYPSSIQYTAHPATGLLPTQEVKFTWEPRPDLERDYRFGELIETNQRLKAVETFTNGLLVKKYTLAYTESPITRRSLLSTVTTVGSDGVTSLPPISLKYSDTFGGWFSSNVWNNPPTPENLLLFFAEGPGGSDAGRRLEDINGDGLPDLLESRHNSQRCWRNTGSGWVLDNRWAPPQPFIESGGKDAGARFVDLNGDSRVDLYYGRLDAPVTAYLNTSSGWSPRSDAWSTLPTGKPLLMVIWDQVEGRWDWRDTSCRFVDLNGDGKSDLIQSGAAFLNTGNGWVEAYRWAPPYPLVANDYTDAGARFGDFNGDGLTDLAYGRDGASPGSAVYLNTGNGPSSTGAGWVYSTAWNSPQPWGSLYFASKAGAATPWRLMDINGDGKVDLWIGDPNSLWARINTGSGWVTDDRFGPPLGFHLDNGQDGGARFADLNGDGMTDIYYGREIDPARHVDYLWTSTTGVTLATPPDLLTQVNNGIGGTTTLTFRPSTAYDNSGGDGIADLPFVTPTVATQTIANGLGWSATTQFTCSGGNFNAAEREFLGFSYAKVTDPEGHTAETWFLQDPHLKGRPFKQEAKDAAGKLYTRSENAWACTDLFPAAKVHFCHLAETTSTVFDGDATSKQTKASFTYDHYGNVTQQVEHGETSLLGDERTTTTEYTLNSSLWLMAFPSHTLTVDSANTKLAEAWFFYDGNALSTDPPTKGLATKSEAWLSTGPPNPVATSTYNPYGNRISTTDTLGRTTTTTYDPQAIFPIQVTNALGHTLKTTYDPSTGAVLTTTDPNSQVTRNVYDTLGRLTAVIGPQDSETSPAVRYEFDLSSLPTRVTKQSKFTHNPAPFTSAYYTSHAFADGLGRVIQTRAPAENSAQQIVSGNVDLGSRGQVIASCLPYFAANSDRYAPPPPNTPKVRYEYDSVGRVTKTTDPDGATTGASYNDWTVTLTDAKGNTTVKESDAYGRLVKVTEPATADHGAGTTTYAYDPLGRLTQVTDARGNVTRIAYDSLGRKRTMDDPDMGHWEYTYDLLGNLTRQTDAKGQILEFTYDALNRLVQKRGLSPQGTVPAVLASYAYDAGADPTGSPKPNLIGRLSKATYPSGSTEFFYDRLGRETKTVKVIDGASFTVQREYDPLNRLTQLTYPDSTLVRYAYTPQGINRITFSLDSGQTFSDLLTNADFNAANETLKLALGNGLTTDYAYDPLTLRISSIRTANASLRTLQDFTYAFDPVGNLTALTDRVNTASQTFRYDQLNRLQTAAGPYGSFLYQYDSLGNLLSKDNGAALTYGLADGTKPHAVTSLRAAAGGEAISLSYDPNGNLTQQGAARTVQYDLENRPVEIVKSSGQSSTILFTLQPGWNAIGLPFAVADPSIRAVLSSLALGTEYDQLSKPKAGTPPWDSFVGDPDADQTTTLDFGKGFWIHNPKASSVTFSISASTPSPRRTLSLSAGWNLIAAPNLAPASLFSTLLGLASGTDYSDVKRWNSLTQAFEALTPSSTVSPGDALWINVLAAKQWQYPTPLITTTTFFTYDGDGGRVKLTTDGTQTSTFVGELYETLPGGTSRTHIFFGPTRLATLERTPLLIASAAKQSRSFLARADSALSRRTPRKLRRALAAVEEFFVGTAYAATPTPSGTQLHYYHPDHLGSVNLITDHTGAQVRLQEFSPFGTLSRSEQAPGAGDNPFHFTGKRLDSSTGLYYYGARYYDPELGRFIQADPTVQHPDDPQDLNRYAYARNNPLRYVDPTGLGWNPFRGIARALGKIGRVVVSAIVAAVTFVAVGIATGGNVHLAAASAAAMFSYTNTFLNASAQGASLGRAWGAATVNGLAAFGAVYFGWNAGIVGATLIGAGFGAAGGATSSAILGGNPGTGALSGAVGGATMAVAAPVFGLVGGAAAAGAASAAVAGGNVGEGAYLGAIGAITFLVASASFQAAVDAGRARAAAKGAAPAEADSQTATLAANKEQVLAQATLRQRGVDSDGSVLTVNQANQKVLRAQDMMGQGQNLVEVGLAMASIGASRGNGYLGFGGLAVAGVGAARWIYGGYVQAQGMRELNMIRFEDARESGIEPAELFY